MKGDLTFFQREVLCALIVVEVHARDVTRSLVDESVRNMADFQWICQLRSFKYVLKLKVCQTSAMTVGTVNHTRYRGTSKLGNLRNSNKEFELFPRLWQDIWPSIGPLRLCRLLFVAWVEHNAPLTRACS